MLYPHYSWIFQNSIIEKVLVAGQEMGAFSDQKTSSLRWFHEGGGGTTYLYLNKYQMLKGSCFIIVLLEAKEKNPQQRWKKSKDKNNEWCAP